MNVSRPELRARARAKLGGNIFAANWLMALVAILIVSLIMSAVSFTGIGELILIGPLGFGLALIFLSLARGKESVDFGDLLKGFTDGGFVRLLLLGLLQNIFIILWYLLFIIPGIVKTYSYSMSYYLAIDHPDWDWKQCIDESRRIMDGNKWKLFVLDLSFIGWYIVGMLACGIGVLWVYPYNEAARAEFYQELTGGVVVEEKEAA